MIYTIVADDHQMVTEGIRLILQQNKDIEVIGEARNGREVLELVRQNPHTNLLILDVEMPEVNGIEVTRHVRRHFPNIRILILTFHNEAEYIYNFQQMGVNGYVLKNKSGKTLLGAIQDIMVYGNPHFPLVKDWGPSRPTWKPEHIKLTQRESDVLKLVDLSAQEIADRLGIGEKTVNHHLKNMRRKFNVDSSSKLLRKAIRLGFIEA